MVTVVSEAFEVGEGIESMGKLRLVRCSFIAGRHFLLSNSLNEGFGNFGEMSLAITLVTAAMTLFYNNFASKDMIIRVAGVDFMLCLVATKYGY